MLDEYERTIELYGQQRAERMMGRMLKHYTRLAYIDTGQHDQARYREYARRVANRLGLRYEELRGSNTLIKKMLHGPWDDEFVVARSGETISYLDFKRTESKT